MGKGKGKAVNEWGKVGTGWVGGGNEHQWFRPYINRKPYGLYNHVNSVLVNIQTLNKQQICFPAINLPVHISIHLSPPIYLSIYLCT